MYKPVSFPYIQPVYFVLGGMDNKDSDINKDAKDFKKIFHQMC